MQARSIERAAIELALLEAFAWAGRVFIGYDTPEAGGFAKHSVAWFISTFVGTLIGYVLPPFALVFLIGYGAARLTSPKPNWWKIYRIAFIVAAIWVLFGHYGRWYEAQQIQR
jgi:hypothetical protein